MLVNRFPFPSSTTTITYGRKTSLPRLSERFAPSWLEDEESDSECSICERLRARLTLDRRRRMPSDGDLFGQRRVKFDLSVGAVN